MRDDEGTHAACGDAESMSLVSVVTGRVCVCVCVCMYPVQICIK